MDDVLSVRDVARKLNISTSAVYRLIHRGTLAAGLIGGVRVVRRSAVAALLGDPAYCKRSTAARKVREQSELEVGA